MLSLQDYNFPLLTNKGIQAKPGKTRQDLGKPGPSKVHTSPIRIGQKRLILDPEFITPAKKSKK